MFTIVFNMYFNVATRNAVQNMMTKMMIEYSITVVATLPILVAYPFLQKYFVKRIMIG